MGKPLWQENDISGQQPERTFGLWMAICMTLEVELLPDEAWDLYNHSPYLDWSFVRNFKKYLVRSYLDSEPTKNCKIINVYFIKLLCLGVIYYTTINN